MRSRAKSDVGGPEVDRRVIEAVVMGLCIGVAALLIDLWVGDAGWTRRILAFLGVGGLMCLIQLLMSRAGRQ